MNRLSLRLNMDAHKEARVIVFDDSRQLPAYTPGVEAKLARERVKARKEQNHHPAAVLGIEFDYKYLGLQTSEFDPSWWGDTWEVTGKGDFKMIWRSGVGGRICFWLRPSSTTITALIVPPSTMDILYCIRMADPEDASFELWCERLGYDTDSRRALKTYRGCVEQTMMFRRNYPGIDLDEYAPLDNY